MTACSTRRRRASPRPSSPELSPVALAPQIGQLFVDRASIIVRTELRQFLFEDLDINLLYLVYLRRIQFVLFLDTGDVGEDLDHVFRNRTDWKWGTGFGFRLWGKSFGVTDLIFRFDVGFRIDETDDLGPRYFVGFGQTF